MSGDINFALISAVRAGDVDRVKTLIDTYGLSYSRGWSEGYSLLIEALMKRRTEVARQLLISGAKVNSKNVHPTETPLHFAAQKNDLEIVNMLLDKHADINAVDKCGSTPLHVAVLNDNAEIVCSLLKNMAHVGVRSKSGKTPLHIAAECGRVQVAEYLLNYGADVNSASSTGLKKGFTPLHSASQRGEQTLVKLLLHKGADINASTEDKSTALHIAAEMKWQKVVKVLLDHGGADINAQNKNGKTVLQIAIEKGDLLTVTHILELCPEINNQENERCDALYGRDIKTCRKVIKTQLGYEITVNSEDAKNIYLLHVAVEKGRLKVIEDLLKYGADINSTLPEEKGFTLLHNAANNNQVEAAKLLINYGVDVNAKDECKKIPLSYAIEKNDIPMTTLLLSSGTTINDYNYSVQTAIARKFEEIVEIILLESDFDINTSDQWGRTALSDALLVDDSDVGIMKMLLDKGANVNAKDRDGRTPLHVACARQNSKIVATLLEYGAEIDSRDSENLSPLHVAAARDSSEIVKILLEQFAEVDCRNKYGETALHVAAKNGWPEVVEELMQSGSDINFTGKTGGTPLDYALDGKRSHGSGWVGCGSDSDDEYWDDGSSNGSGACRSDEVIEILERHIVKIKALNLYLCSRNLESVDIENKRKDFYNNCKYEIEMMKNEKIRDTNVCFYDLLTKGMSQLAIYARNISIVEILESGCYKKKFPIYGNTIYNNFKRGQKRESLLNTSLKSLKILSGFVLPDLSSTELLSYLSNNDLNNLTKACPDTNCGDTFD